MRKTSDDVTYYRNSLLEEKCTEREEKIERRTIRVKLTCKSDCESFSLLFLSHSRIHSSVKKRRKEVKNFSPLLQSTKDPLSQNFLLPPSSSSSLNTKEEFSFFFFRSLLSSSSIARTTPHLYLSFFRNPLFLHSLYPFTHSFGTFLYLSLSLNSVHSSCPFSPLCILEQPSHVLLLSH